MEVEEVELAPQDDRSQATCIRRAVCGIGSSRCKKIQHVKQTKSSSLKKMPSETATVMQTQGSVPSVHAGVPISHTEVEKDGTEWEVINFGNNLSGRRGAQNVVREKSGPTLHARQQIKDNSPLSAWRLLLIPCILLHIETCTEQEARVGLCSKRPSVFTQTMARNRFCEIMRYLRFDERHTRSEHIQTDKLTLVSYVWNGFIQNSIACYNVTLISIYAIHGRKPDKVWIKFWIAANVDSKYFVNGFPYFGKRIIDPAISYLALI
ncbi:hypothetical protein PR048_000363 [Dryococelus australis]|uniref:Uncharacterized protein n=1 Tax=Dryococelus australis TaxID=614101 RepID=A0ABQ9IED5_9NEOP|nr:hypothetical protein PR048_000363 [Dryococelus australis]